MAFATDKNCNTNTTFAVPVDRTRRHTNLQVPDNDCPTTVPANPDRTRRDVVVLDDFNGDNVDDDVRDPDLNKATSTDTNKTKRTINVVRTGSIIMNAD